MAYSSQDIVIPDNYIWDQKQAEEELARVLAAAAAGAPAQAYTPGSRSITDTYMPPEKMAALYPMNAVNEQVGLAGATGYKLPGAGGRTLFDLLQAGENMAANKMSPAFQGTVGQSLTGETPSEINLRNAQAEFYRDKGDALAGGGGAGGRKAAIADLMKSIGDEGWDAKAADYVADGSIDLKDMQKLEIQKKARTLSEKQTEGINLAEKSYQKLEKLSGLYEDTTAAKTGKMSEDFKLGLATMSTTGALTAELAAKLSPADRAFIAQYGLLGLDLRGLANDSRFSNFDAERALRALGNPAVGGKLYKEQLGSVMDDIAFKHRGALKNYEIAGRKVQRYQPLLSRAERANTYIRVSDGQAVTGTQEQLKKALEAGHIKRSY